MLQVEAVLAASGSVHARIVNDGGDPVEGAGLAVVDGGYMAFLANNQPVTPTGSISDKGGAISLTGLPTGEVLLQVEARGFEPQTIAVKIEAGGDLDLGDVTLVKAVGTITVKLTGMQDGAKYRVAVAHPNGPPVYPAAVAVDGKAVLSQLPLRTYLVCAFPAVGGRVVKELVALDSSHVDAEVQLDVSSLGK